MGELRNFGVGTSGNFGNFSGTSGTESYDTKWEIAQLRRSCLNQIADHYRSLSEV